MEESYKSNLQSKSTHEMRYEDLVRILSSFPTEVIEEICSKAKMLRESLHQEQLSVTSHTDAEADMASNDFVDNANLQTSTENEIYLMKSQSFDYSQETSTVTRDRNNSEEGEAVEKIQEDTSELEALYLETQQEAFDEFVKPNFPIQRLPQNAFCREWLLKHAECCLKGSLLEHSDNNQVVQVSNQNSMALPNIESDDNTHGTKNTVDEECDTQEKMQEDAFELPALYLEIQQSPEDFIRQNFPITVSICDKQQVFGNSEESNKIRKDEINSDEGETSENIQDVYTMKEDTDQNSSHGSSDLQISTEIPLPSTKSSDNSLQIMNVIGDEVETLEILQEDTSPLQALHLENQKGAFDESAKPKRRSKTKTCPAAREVPVMAAIASRGMKLRRTGRDDRRDRVVLVPQDQNTRDETT
ncbi:hypothetical protein AVEN_211713-1 [Araneus ventricosus]|uniref:Uncharacterized protein n=1 Tax=Araneus ventricosus TaxID=182803 RepID=A0A4Y2TBL7_ARAVE|nr:hypothetical protein AVEN_211713-1 [Araneus ventricosus]